MTEQTVDDDDYLGCEDGDHCSCWPDYTCCYCDEPGTKDEDEEDWDA